MKVYLVQHGLAVDKSVDPERPLSEQGQADILKLAGFLKSAGIAPPLFFHSGKKRAQQTAQILASTLDGSSIKALEQINPNDALESAIQFIAQTNQDTMLVGHLPFMQRLVSFLLCENETVSFSYQPGTMVCLAHDNDVWSMEWMIRPDLLKTTSQ